MCPRPTQSDVIFLWQVSSDCHLWPHQWRNSYNDKVTHFILEINTKFGTNCEYTYVKWPQPLRCSNHIKPIPEPPFIYMYHKVHSLWSGRREHGSNQTSLVKTRNAVAVTTVAQTITRHSCMAKSGVNVWYWSFQSCLVYSYTSFHCTYQSNVGGRFTWLKEVECRPFQ